MHFKKNKTVNFIIYYLEYKTYVIRKITAIPVHLRNIKKKYKNSIHWPRYKTNKSYISISNLKKNIATGTNNDHNNSAWIEDPINEDISDFTKKNINDPASIKINVICLFLTEKNIKKYSWYWGKENLHVKSSYYKIIRKLRIIYSMWLNKYWKENRKIILIRNSRSCILTCNVLNEARTE